MKIRVFSLICLLAGVCSTLRAQEDLTRDRAFFEQQARNYQRWLDETGLSPRLKVRAIEVLPQRLSLYLQFPTDNVDTVKALWIRLHQDYAALETGLRLEDALFFKMVQLMEVQPSVADLQVYDSYNPLREPNFLRAIHLDAQEVRVDSSGDMGVSRVVNLSPGDLGGWPRPSTFECGRRYQRDIVLQQSYDFLRLYFLSLRCDSLPPEVGEPQKTGDIWRFEVMGLCLESLRHAPESVVQPFLVQNGKPADWIRYEKLSVTLVYQGRGNGCRLNCQLEVKVGNAPYDEVGRGAYLDPGWAFVPYTQKYTDGLMERARVLVCGK